MKLHFEPNLDYQHAAIEACAISSVGRKSAAPSSPSRVTRLAQLQSAWVWKTTSASATG